MSEPKSPTDLAALTLEQLEDTLFRDSAIEVTERVNERDPVEGMQALLDTKAAIEADAQAEAEKTEPQEVEVPTPESPAEPAIEEPPTPDASQQYLAQSQEILNYLAQQQHQQTQHQQQQVEQQRLQQQQAANSDEAVNEAIRSAGLNPADPMHQFAYRQSMESNMMEQRILEMEQRVKVAEHQAYTSRAQAELTPRIDDTLKAYGDIPQSTVDTIKTNAATAMSHGYDQQQSVDMAIAPYLDLLRHMKGIGGTPTPVAKNDPPQKTRDETGLLAASLTGRSTGHGKTIENLSIDDIEKVLFK
tara:strand:- start:48 stop:956 length:909 start_codon:yes stop_codon:yes gene_type:complete